MTEDLGLIDGVTSEIAEKLRKEEILTIEQLADAEIKTITSIFNGDMEKAEKLIAAADNYLNAEPEPETVTGQQITSKYSMKPTEKRED